MAAKQMVVLYPSPAIGHLIAMVELGKVILKHHPSLSITILNTTPPYNTGSTAPYINQVSQTTPLIHFHHLPTVSLPSSDTPHIETLAFQLLQLNNPLVHQALLTISQSSTIRSFVIDSFCTPAHEIATSLNIPTYYFYTSGVSVLANLLYFPTFTKINKNDLNDQNAYLDFPGLPRIAMRDMPKPMMDRNDKASEFVMNVAVDMPKSQGIIVNSFEALEPRALKAISDGLCIPDAPTPPIYCIGPLVAGNERNNAHPAAHGCLTWLDSQPNQSVVFLCFGSLGLFTKTQLHEIAIGLENSGMRFLWVVRSPPTEDNMRRFLAPPEPDLDVLLPQGFVNRTENRGLVVKSWAPQVEVLSHESVGGFVTHCGWNSVLESVCAGVPMVAWPLYAEQKMNKVIMVEEIKIALQVEESEDGFVTTSELEKQIRELMDSDEGKAVRERTARMSEEAKAAMRTGGSSLRSLTNLVRIWVTSG